jgi:Rrf2 family nitric oxide-sensitive transcriptional repressor
MRLTRYTDYSLRVLMYLGTHEDRLCSIGEIAEAHRVSRNHLMKVVNALAHSGYVDAVRGRSGGLRLGRPPVEIRIGELVRTTEEGLQLADCPSCVIAPACRLKGVLAEGVAAMLQVFDGYTLADLLTPRRELRRLLTTAAPPVASRRA